MTPPSSTTPTSPAGAKHLYNRRERARRTRTAAPNQHQNRENQLRLLHMSTIPSHSSLKTPSTLTLPPTKTTRTNRRHSSPIPTQTLTPTPKNHRHPQLHQPYPMPQLTVDRRTNPKDGARAATISPRTPSTTRPHHRAFAQQDLRHSRQIPTCQRAFAVIATSTSTFDASPQQMQISTTTNAQPQTGSTLSGEHSH